MGLNDRGNEFDGGGQENGFRRALRRIFVEGDNPLTWAFPLFRVGGIDVRAHFMFVLYVVIELVTSLMKSQMGFWQTLVSMVVLFTLVLLHEFGHCIACRHVRGEADSILLWPLGGLANCSPPHEWRANLITTLGGPAVNLALFPVLGLALLAAGAGWSVVLLFNPFHPAGVLSELWFQSDGRWGTALTYAKQILWWTYYVNALLLAFNMLLPMYPMDAARTIQAILWRRIGYTRATRLTVNAGIFVAVVVGVFAITTGHMMLVGLAVFGGMMSTIERQRLDMTSPEFDTGAPGGFGGGEGGGRMGASGDSGEARRFALAAKKQEAQRLAAEADQREVDRILAKIASDGIASLSAKEKATLQKATERQRQGGARR